MRERLASAWRAAVERILGVEDTPHRVAWGVFLGTVLAFTPTLGFQIVLYVAIATLLRANKVSGVPILFISNPVSAVPLYWSTWKVGSLLLGRAASGGATPSDAQLQALGGGTNGGASGGLAQMLTARFWVDLGETLVGLGAELWIGGLFLGVLFGLPAYAATRWAVRVYRARGGAAAAPPQADEP